MLAQELQPESAICSMCLAPLQLDGPKLLCPQCQNNFHVHCMTRWLNRPMNRNLQSMQCADCREDLRAIVNEVRAVMCYLCLQGIRGHLHILTCDCHLMYNQHEILRFISIRCINVTEARELQCSNCNGALFPLVLDLPPAEQNVAINIFPLDGFDE